MKKFALAMILVLCVIVLAGCDEIKTGNRVTAGKDVQTFTYAYVSLDGKEIVRGFITQWRDYENSDVVQVMIDGKYYLTHYSNVIMVADPSHGALQYSDPSIVYGVDE